MGEDHDDIAAVRNATCSQRNGERNLQMQRA
jgi:hypothetical protein